ncbi:MAG: hypothetical protein IT324_20535 [Anaerolineae bacterium]|nr:hypothetical protein [Anaerolineae bacterium]
MPYQQSGNRRNSVQFGVGRSVWSGAASPAIPERVFDGVPGFLAWLSLFLVIVGAVAAPLIVFTIAALIGTYMAIRFILAGIANVKGLRLIRQWEHTNWREDYERRRTPDSLNWYDVFHLVVIPNYKEELVVLRQTLDRLAMQSVAREQVIVVLAMEAGEAQAGAKANILLAEYAHCFRHMIATIHPRGISGELQVKSANVTWAIRNAKRQLVDEMGYCIDNFVITTMDADSLLHVKYLEALTCLYATSTMRHASVWQAPIRYHSNVWDIHPALALIHAYSIAWELAYLAAPWWQPLPISTYSLSLKLTDEVGYWDPDVIADELHMFLKCFFRRGGNFVLSQIYLPFSGYAVTGNNFLDASKNRYLQSRRHAWGAKEVGYTMAQMIERPDIPFGSAFKMLLRVAHDNIMAGAGWVIITFGAQLPILLYPSLLSNSWHSPQFILVQISVVITAVLGIVFWLVDMRERPPRSRRWTIKEIILTILSFPLLPILTLFYLAIPAIEAQTRLLLGIPIQFKVARKV